MITEELFVVIYYYKITMFLTKYIRPSNFNNLEKSK